MTFLVTLRRSGPECDASRPLEEQPGWTAHVEPRLAELGRSRDDRPVSADYPDQSVEETDVGRAEKFGPHAVWLSLTTLIVGWLVLVGLHIGGVISGHNLTVGCAVVLGVVGYAAYMWESRRSRWEFAARMPRADGVRRSVRSGYRRSR